MSDEAFLQAIRADPDDEAARLIYADWLDERGNAARAEFLRLQAHLRTLQPDEPRHKDLDVRLREVLASQFDPDWLARVERTDRYTVLWSMGRHREMEAAGEVGRPLSYVLGSPFNPQMRFSDIKLRAGDYVYLLWLRDGSLRLVARMRIQAVPNPKEYFAAHPERRPVGLEWKGWLRRERKSDTEIDMMIGQWAGEILVGEGGTPIRFDLAIPPDMNERYIRADRHLRPVRKTIPPIPPNAMEVSGIHRLTHRSAQDFDDLLRSAWPLGEREE
jgi:uncharacterized protein (TIGR02996 family)